MNHVYSKFALAVCCSFILLTGLFYYPKWEQAHTEATISWDVSGYYFYLPAAFIYRDVKHLRFADSIIDKYKPTPDFHQAYRHSSGNYIIKYTMGQAIILVPFFAAGHIYALISGYPTDGFSFPYQCMTGLGALLYAITGLTILRKALLMLFTDRAVALTILVIVLATNYLNYSAIDGAMPHNTLFALYSILLYLVIRFYRKPSARTAIAIGICTGLLTIIRPTEIISAFIPLLWGISSERKTGFLRKNARRVLISILCMILVLFCQLLYWKLVAGEWIVYSYRNEGFNWLHPQLISGMISYKGGWLTYTPVMILVFPGFIFLYQKYRSIGPVILLFFLLFVYICFSWKEWWYGAGAGQRAIIQCYPVLALPLTSFFERVRFTKIAGPILGIFILFAIAYNVWLTHQAHRGGLFRGGEMNRAYFWAIFGRLHVPRETVSLLDNSERYRGDTSHALYQIVLPVREQTLLQDEWTPEITFSVPAQSEWIQAKFLVSTPQKEWEAWKMPQAIVKFYKGEKPIKTNFVRISRLLNDGETREVIVDGHLPREYDRVVAYLWNPASQKTVTLHGITIRSY